MDTIITDTIRSLVIQANLNNVQVENAQKNPYIIAEGDKQDETKFVSKLGTLVYSNIIFNASQVLKDNKIVDKWDDFRIDDCLISVDQAKKIITTEIAGRDGTVKEYIGLDDFQINIVGRLTGSYGVNPKENAKILKTILSASQPLAITNWWLQNLDITDIVVTGFNFAQTEGEYSTQYFSFSAISDNPVEALITNQNA
jgi:Domain of unknown function (DUF6046)